MKFKNLIGNFQGPAGPPIEEGGPPQPPIVYPPGSTFETDVNLLRHNKKGVKKFERMPDDADVRIASVRAPGQPEESEEEQAGIVDVFSEMTIPQLKQEALDAGIDLGKARLRDDILAILRGQSTGVIDSGDE